MGRIGDRCSLHPGVIGDGTKILRSVLDTSARGTCESDRNKADSTGLHDDQQQSCEQGQT
jgi:hypothetical protein